MASSSPIPMLASSPAASTMNAAPVTSDVKAEKDCSPAITPSKTPKKRTASQKKSESDDDEEYVTPKKTKGTPKSATTGSNKRKANKNPNRAMPMGRTYEQCAEHDKKLIDMRDTGKSWKDIRKEWTKLTGETTAPSTLPNRYSRLKTNFVVIREEDNPVLIEAKQEVEAGFQREKWSLIAQAMKEKGTEEYKPDALHKQYKKLMIFAKELQEDNLGKGKARMTRASTSVAEEDEDAEGSDDEE